MIRYERLPSRPDGWDETIQKYPAKTLFHESAWLDHVQSIHPRGRIVYYRITEDGTTIGFHAGLRISKLLLPIHGSPLGGTGTNFMGPVTDASADQREVIRGLVRLSGAREFLHLEVNNPWFDRRLMEEEGFSVQDSVTHVIDVPGDVESAWSGMKGPARNRVRKAISNELVVEQTDDPSIVDHFFEQFKEIYAKQGMHVPFGIERPRSLFENLLPAGRLLPIWVRRGNDVLAAGLFPYDERAIYFWGAGSWLKYQSLCPNEALQWGVIEFAVMKGIPLYNMCGGQSQFKNKFGGTDVPNPTYYRSFVPGLAAARHVYRALHFRSLKAGVSRGPDAGEQ